MRHATNGIDVAEVNGNTIGECLQYLTARFPLLEKQLLSEPGKLLPFIDIYVNGRSSYPEVLTKPVKDGDELSIRYIIGGG